jgi:putative Mg2+ transporter-C (MgtC) family protein
MSTWDRIAATIVSEFSDLNEVEDITRIVLRLVLAAVLGAVLGFEREHASKAAGLRTHMLVSLGSALFVLASLQAGIQPGDLSRVIQGVVAGIGFLCAGAILKSPQDDQVRGLTTSAGLWMTAAIGMTAGLGREAIAVFGALLALGILMLEKPVRRLMRRDDPSKQPDD